MSDGNDQVKTGSDNVFSDLGLPNADEEYLKAELALLIRRTLRDRGLTQIEAARLMGETQPNVSNIIGGKLKAFSVERLMKHLGTLGKDLELRVTDMPKSRTQGQLRVVG